jgi:hypothetical protein
MMRVLSLSLLVAGGGLSTATAAGPTAPVAPYVNLGTEEAVQGLIERVNPGAGSHFVVALAESCPGSTPPCFTLSDEGDKVKVTATGAAELSYGVGHYLREYCNMTIVSLGSQHMRLSSDLI